MLSLNLISLNGDLSFLTGLEGSGKDTTDHQSIENFSIDKMGKKSVGKGFKGKDGCC